MANRRAHPRTMLDLKVKLGVRHTSEAQFFDISEGGASFLSNTGYEVGSEITLEFGSFTIQVRVLASALIPPQQGLKTKQFKVRCQFVTIDGLAAQAFFAMVTEDSPASPISL